MYHLREKTQCVCVNMFPKSGIQAQPFVMAALLFFRVNDEDHDDSSQSYYPFPILMVLPVRPIPTLLIVPFSTLAGSLARLTRSLTSLAAIGCMVLL